MVSKISTIDVNVVDVTRIREMGELELYGAVSYIYEVIKDFEEREHGECYTTWNDIDSATYYANKKLELTEDYMIQDDEGRYCVLDYVFMLEGNNNVLLGLAHLEDLDNEGEEYLDDTFYVRFDA